MEALLDDVGSLVCRSTEGRIDIPTNLVMVQLTLLMEHEAIPVDQDRELAGITRTSDGRQRRPPSAAAWTWIIQLNVT